jgi:restriction system protein
MAIPPFDHFLRPVLSALSNGEEVPAREVIASTARSIGLTPEELAETLKGTGRNRAENRTGWALNYLVQSGALLRPRRGCVQITPLGLELLEKHPDTMRESDLQDLEGYQDYMRRSKAASLARRKAERLSTPDQQHSTFRDSSPLESLVVAIEALDRHTASELVQRLREQEPDFLERAVLRLMHAMGYGGSLNDGEHLGRSHDGGLDGVIRQDALGLERVYVQAKRYAESNTVGSAAIREFVGALTGVGASGGVFITTSSFSTEAKKYVERLTPRVILIDGHLLGQLMVEYEVGVSVTQILKVTEVDENFFEN